MKERQSREVSESEEDTGTGGGSRAILYAFRSAVSSHRVGARPFRLDFYADSAGQPIGGPGTGSPMRMTNTSTNTGHGGKTSVRPVLVEA